MVFFLDSKNRFKLTSLLPDCIIFAKLQLLMLVWQVSNNTCL